MFLCVKKSNINSVVYYVYIDFIFAIFEALIVHQGDILFGIQVDFVRKLDR